MLSASLPVTMTEENPDEVTEDSIFTGIESSTTSSDEDRTVDKPEIADEVEGGMGATKEKSESEPKLIKNDEESDSDALSEAIAGVVEEEGLTILDTIGDIYQENKNENRSHERQLMKDQMMYNGTLLLTFIIVVMILVYTTSLQSVAALTFLAGIATGFGANTVLNSAIRK